MINVMRRRYHSSVQISVFNLSEYQNQIKDRDYYRQDVNSGKKIFLIGVNFDSEAGQITDWQTEEVKADN